MLTKLAKLEGFVACHTLDQVFIEHFSYERRWFAIATTNIFANFTYFVILLQILIIKLHA